MVTSSMTNHRLFTEDESRIASIMQPRVEDFQLQCPECGESGCIRCDNPKWETIPAGASKVEDFIPCPTCKARGKRSKMLLVPIPCLLLVQEVLRQYKALNPL